MTFTVLAIFSCVSIYESDQFTRHCFSNLKTDLEDIAQDTHSAKGFHYYLSVFRTFGNAGTGRTILQVFDSVHLKFDGAGNRG
jgi:hypothetical protein